MSVFEKMRNGKSYSINDPEYQKEVHGEINRARHLCYQINQTDPNDNDRIIELGRLQEIT